jgi:site-specific DNA-methyltransferase (adenine-specific)
VNDATIDGSETLTSAKQKIFFREECGFNIHDTMIYLKDQIAFPSNGRYHQAFEYMIVLSRGKPKTFNPIMDRKNGSYGRSGKVNARKKTGETIKGNKIITIREYCERLNYWLIYNQERGLENEHPAVYPEQIAFDHIRSWSNEGDTVLDCFSGSGTTMKAAKLLKRNSIGIEIAKEYCELTVRRINKPIPLFEAAS